MELSIINLLLGALWVAFLMYSKVPDKQLLFYVIWVSFSTIIIYSL